jgi:D-aminopeptidase
MAENAALMPYSKRVDEKTVAFSADDYLTAFKGLLAMITLAG